MGNCFSTNKSPPQQNPQYNNTNVIKQNPINSKEFTTIPSKDPQMIHNHELLNAINARHISLTTMTEPKLNYPQQPLPMIDLSNKPEEIANYIVLFDYEKATKDDITIRKNDYLFVIDKSHSDWWLAKNLRTLDTGYVPFNYITAVDNLEIKEYA
jgi:hypothetical protein